MERNDTFSNGTTPNTPSTPSSATTNTYGANSTSSTGGDLNTEAHNLADRAKSAAGTAGDKLSDLGSNVRDKAGNLKGSIANALESGAERLRNQGAGGGQFAGANATGDSAGMLADDSSRLAQTGNQLAGGLQASADWLRDADMDGIKSGLEQQVKDHPARTLAVAVGLGYLLGKAFRS